jgi:hypothetical protein
MAADDSADVQDPYSLTARHALLRQEMLAQTERFIAAGKHWKLYVFLGWEHLGVCAASHFILEVLDYRKYWPFLILWLVQSAIALGAVTWFRRRTPLENSPLQSFMSRVWFVFLLMSWNVAALNIAAGLPRFVLLPALATLSSFAFLVLAGTLSRKLTLAALTMWITGCVMMYFPQYGFLLYGFGWLLVLETLGLVFYRRRNQPLSKPAEEPAIAPLNSLSPPGKRVA